MEKGKSPGVDGLPIEFFATFWDIIMVQLVEIVGFMWRSAIIPDSISIGVITLIPKKMARARLEDWRPITLANVIWKILTKLIAERLGRALPRIIHQGQSASVKGRHITDNILTASLALEYARETRTETVFLKLDFKKAFDRIDHRFLERVLVEIGLGPHIRRLIAGLCGGAQSKLFISGQFTAPINLERGVRQGCPLSPLLFTLATEVLSDALERQVLQPPHIGLPLPDGTRLTHRMHSDDTLCISLLAEEHVTALIEQVGRYCEWSGSELNLGKSVAVVSTSHVPDFLRELGLTCLGPGCPTMYLGVPFGSRLSAAQRGQACLDRVAAFIAKWSGCHLSFAMRAVILRHALTGVPVYFYSTCIFAKGVFKQLESMCRAFLWGSKVDGSPKTSLRAFSEITLPRVMGGLGVRDLRTHALAMLGKDWVKVIAGISTPWWTMLEHLILKAPIPQLGAISRHMDRETRLQGLPDG